MNYKIHRGTQEIGGSCVELWTENTRILLDFGMPLVEKDGSEFNFKKYEKLDSVELISKGVLPNIKGLYKNEDPEVDAIIITHPHADHYGFLDYIHEDIPVYMGEATHKLIELSNIFLPQNINLENVCYYKKDEPFKVGDINITPYGMDHSAFDAYALLVEADGKRLFYSGDFRSHGRKGNVFQRFLNNPPKNIDHLLMEGTTIGRGKQISRTEVDIENEMYEKFKEPGKLNLVYASGQNIDRIVSIYKACKKAKKTLVMDVYVANIMKTLSEFASLPHPSSRFKDIKVCFPYFTGKRLKRQNREDLMYKFKSYKVTRQEIDQDPSKYVMIVRGSMQKELDLMENIDGGNFIYSMWEGYLKKKNTKEFVEHMENDKAFNTSIIHTSGHADIQALQELAEAVDPKFIVPIHTFDGDKYKDIFKGQILELKDGEEVSL
ncbi:MAG: MBL fold metallo-hydrolase [Candidatus Cloacimonetes bacterium]|nr:MBL fold metallo-hydrolase [Candidatus Cloacimonadota bacterium]